MFGKALSPVMMGFDQSMPLPMTDDNGAGVVYIGYCKQLGIAYTDKKWLIIRITTSGQVTTPEYANGDSGFNFAWSDRSTLTYSR